MQELKEKQNKKPPRKLNKMYPTSDRAGNLINGKMSYSEGTTREAPEIKHKIIFEA